MKTQSRNSEKNAEIIKMLEREYEVKIDLDSKNGAALEGTGALIFDKTGK